MLIHELTLRNLLSFGPLRLEVRLEPLNLLIGPNGSGKSNFLDAISLLRASATKLTAPVRGAGGGAEEWIWKGDADSIAELRAILQTDAVHGCLSHHLAFQRTAQRFVLCDESIVSVGKYGDSFLPDLLPEVEEYDKRYEYHSGVGTIYKDGGEPNGATTAKKLADDESILSQRRDPDLYPSLSLLAEQYERIRIYRDWSFGRSSIIRRPQPADAPSDVLEDDCSNFGMFLNRLRTKPITKRRVLEELRNLYAGLDDFDVRVIGGYVEVYLVEGDFVIPASRLSDGTLRYLCLVALLCDPSPPPLICIEEPELGLHPDLMPKIADLLVDASTRTQVVVTTHSDVLVDAMTERPECVLVFEKHNSMSTAKRLNREELQVWLNDYRLGELWTSGQIGGNRW